MRLLYTLQKLLFYAIFILETIGNDINFSLWRFLRTERTHIAYEKKSGNALSVQTVHAVQGF